MGEGEGEGRRVQLSEMECRKGFEGILVLNTSYSVLEREESFFLF